ncbi:MAG: hypothetical protein ACJ8NS_03115 [Chthoniobacterales bacterium]
MDVQTLLDQERGLRQSQFHENTVRAVRWQENLLRQETEHWRLAELARRVSLAGSCDVLSVALIPRPFDALISRMEEQSRGFQRLADMTSSAIAKTVSDAVKIGETYRRLIDPIPAIAKTVSDAVKIGETLHRLIDPMPAIRNVLEPLTVARSFDAMRYVIPLADFERQFNALRDHTFSRLSDVRSTVAETIAGLSRVVELATAYADNPPVRLPESYADFSLNDVVDVVGDAVESNAEPDLLEVAGLLQRIEARLSALELILSTPTFRENVAFWLGIIGFLISVLSLCLQLDQNSHQLCDQKQPPALQSATPAPRTADAWGDYSGPCP